MNDVMPLLDLGCTCFLKTAIGIALLCFSKLLWHWSKPEKRVEPTVTTVTSNSVAPDFTSKNTYSVVASTPTRVRTPEPEPEPQEVIECGACHKEIRSEPIQQIMDPANPSEIYKCESCGAQVSVPL